MEERIVPGKQMAEFYTECSAPSQNETQTEIKLNTEAQLSEKPKKHNPTDQSVNLSHQLPAESVQKLQSQVSEKSRVQRMLASPYLSRSDRSNTVFESSPTLPAFMNSSVLHTRDILTTGFHESQQVDLGY